MRSWRATTCSWNGCGRRIAGAEGKHAGARRCARSSGSAGRRAARTHHLPACTHLPQDKIHNFWDVTKRELGDRKTELRLKDRELEEVQVRLGTKCVHANVT